MKDALTEPRGSWGHAIRCATMDERHDTVDGAGWIARTCGRRCGEPVQFRVSYRVTGVDQVPRLFQRFVCPVHARAFTRRYGLPMPPALPTDQALLPFGGS